MTKVVILIVIIMLVIGLIVLGINFYVKASTKNQII